jgi:enoyl-CoA hydratase
MNESILVENNGGLTTIYLNRPPANAIDLPTAQALRTALIEFRESTAAALILTGVGDVFCGGLDLKVVPTYDRQARDLLMRTLGEVVFELFSSPRPVVAALNGHAVAAGSLFTLCCDHRIAPADNCKFGFTGARVGVPYPETAMTIITSQLSASVARRLLLSARTFDQNRALQDGLVDELLPVKSVMTRAIEIAKDLASMPADHYATVKRQVRGPTTALLLDALTREHAASDGVWVAAT